MSIRPKQPHDVCECAWCQLHRLPEKWRIEATYSDRVHAKVRIQCAEHLELLLRETNIFGRRAQPASSSQPPVERAVEEAKRLNEPHGDDAA